MLLKLKNEVQNRLSGTVRRQLRRFIIVGLCAVGTDAIVYNLLLEAEIGIREAKAGGFIAGTIVAYWANKFYTFQTKKLSAFEIMRFAMLYATSLFANNVTNSYTIETFGYDHKLVAFLFATGVSTVMNFLGQKFWVFKR